MPEQLREFQRTISATVARFKMGSILKMMVDVGSLIKFYITVSIFLSLFRMEHSVDLTAFLARIRADKWMSIVFQVHKLLI